MTCGDKSLDKMTIEELHHRLLTDLDLDTLPSPRIEPTFGRKRMETQISSHRFWLKTLIKNRLRGALDQFDLPSAKALYWNAVNKGAARIKNPGAALKIRSLMNELDSLMHQPRGVTAPRHAKFLKIKRTLPRELNIDSKRRMAFASVASSAPRVTTVREDSDDTFSLAANDNSPRTACAFAHAARSRNLVTPIRESQNPFEEPWSSECSRRQDGSAVSRLRRTVSENREQLRSAMERARSPPRSRSHAGSRRRSTGPTQSRASSRSRRREEDQDFVDLLDDSNHVRFETDSDQAEYSHEDDLAMLSEDRHASSGSDSSRIADSGVDDISLPSLEDLRLSNEEILTGSATTDQLAHARQLQRSAERLRTAKKQLASAKRSRKRKTRSAETIFRYLMKAVESHKLPILDYKSEPSRRRGSFIRFLDRLKLVTSSVSETLDVLSNPGAPVRPSTRNANKALFRVLCARVDSCLVGQLHELQSRRRKEDGYSALKMLRSLFADTDNQDYNELALNDFQMVKLHSNESAFDFNKRFGYLYRAVVGTGQTISEQRRIRHYLRALLEHRNTRILYEVKAKMKELDSGRRLILQKIQSDLVTEEEQSKGGGSRLITQTTVRHTPRSGRTRTRRCVASAAGKKARSEKPPRKIVCWGCTMEGHSLRDCRSTSEADKKRICEMSKLKRMDRTARDPSRPSESSTMKAQANPATRPRRVRERSQLPRPRGDLPRPSILQRSTAENVKKATSHANAVESKDKSHRATACCNMARRMAWCTLAKEEKDTPPLQEGDVGDPFDIVPPPIGEDDVHRNPNAKIVCCEDSVLLDSGASDCMTHTFEHLDLIRSANANVCLADGTVHDCNFQGLMRVSVIDILNQERFVVPMVDTLLVPGLRTALWSVSALAEQGHEVRFGFSTVSLALHADTQNELMIRMRHPLMTHSGQTNLPFNSFPTEMAHAAFPLLDNGNSVRHDSSPDRAEDEDNRTAQRFLHSEEEGESSTLDPEAVEWAPYEDPSDQEGIEPSASLDAFPLEMPRHERDGAEGDSDSWECVDDCDTPSTPLDYPEDATDGGSPTDCDTECDTDEVPEHAEERRRAQPGSSNAPRRALASPATRVDIDELPVDFYPPGKLSRQCRRCLISNRMGSGEMIRRCGTLAIHYAGLAERLIREEEQQEIEERNEQAEKWAKRPRISLELMHRRLGHRATKSILLGEESKLHSDSKVVPDPDDFCENCKISTIRAANRGKEREETQSKPGQVLFLDAQRNIGKRSLTSSTNYPACLMICDEHSRCFRLGNMKGESTKTARISKTATKFMSTPDPS